MWSQLDLNEDGTNVSPFQTAILQESLLPSTISINLLEKRLLLFSRSCSSQKDILVDREDISIENCHSYFHEHEVNLYPPP